MSEPELLVDPAVSRAKFAREVARYRELEDDYIRRGWWMVRAEFPEVFVVFGSPAVNPPAVAFGALLDFTNYDLWPPSVRLVNPFTRVRYRPDELPTRLPRRLPGPPDGAGQSAVVVQPLVQHHGPDGVPFVCLPGVREYHQHPAHSGDSWLLRRSRGEGTLHFLLDQLDRFGVRPIKGYNMGMQLVIAGFQLEPPE